VCPGNRRRLIQTASPSCKVVFGRLLPPENRQIICEWH
jgi:hypothetical protein